MKHKLTKLLTLMLALTFVLCCFAGCGNSGDEPTGGKETTTSSEDETTDELTAALNQLDAIDWNRAEFGILTLSNFKDEVYGEYGASGDSATSSQIISDAVYERNLLFEERCNLKLSIVEKDSSSIDSAVQKESSTNSGDFYLIDNYLSNTANAAVNGYLYNYLDLDIDLDYSWWDSGTADFALAGCIYFMTGDTNFADDNVTYVLIFNKQLQKNYNVDNPYETVKNNKWTLSYFNQVIQGISSDNGDGKWDENDTYGFLTTWEYGNTFFIGCDLRYINNSRETDTPTLYLTDKMDKAVEVVNLARQIYHNNNATYMSPGGSEANGLTAFKENRGLFYGEVASYLPKLNSEMDDCYGVLPVPKYDEAQEYYRTWTHNSGSCLSITAAVSDANAEMMGNTVQAYAILSSKYVKPAYYDIMLTTRNVTDAESSEMLDIIFQNRVYEMSFYFQTAFPGYYDLVKTCVNDNKDTFSSSYASTAKSFNTRISSMIKKLEKNNKS
jgi:hypothetical protein